MFCQQDSSSLDSVSKMQVVNNARFPTLKNIKECPSLPLNSEAFLIDFLYELNIKMELRLSSLP